jgi:hypothetical protein
MMTTYETSQFDLDREKIAIEREKIAMERERLDLEPQKLREERCRTLLTAGSIFGSVLIAALTFFYHICALHQEAALAHELQVVEAQAAFELKAAEIVMDTQTPLAAKNRTRALADLFPDRLPSDFAITFDPAVYGGSTPLEARIELFRALVEYPDRALEIHSLWSDAFPSKDWWLFIPSGEPDVH